MLRGGSRDHYTGNSQNATKAPAKTATLLQTATCAICARTPSALRDSALAIEIRWPPLAPACVLGEAPKGREGT